MVSITFNFKKKDLFLVLAIGIFVIGMGFVVAYKSDWVASPGNPAVMGHTPDEIFKCAENETIKVVGGKWTCAVVEGSGGSSNDKCSYFSIDNGYREVSLIKDGKNICELPHGCEIILFKSSFTFADGFEIYDIDGDPGIYLQDSDGDYRERIGESGESSGINGDSTEVSMRSFGQCTIYDDRTDQGISVSKDNLVLRDATDDNLLCSVSICDRN